MSACAPSAAQHLHVHLGQALAGHADDARGAAREVDDATGDEGTAVVDRHVDRAAVADVGHAHAGAERQRAMGGRQAIRIEGRARSRALALPIIRCDAAAGRTGRDVHSRIAGAAAALRTLLAVLVAAHDVPARLAGRLHVAVGLLTLRLAAHARTILVVPAVPTVVHGIARPGIPLRDRRLETRCRRAHGLRVMALRRARLGSHAERGCESEPEKCDFEKRCHCYSPTHELRWA